MPKILHTRGRNAVTSTFCIESKSAFRKRDHGFLAAAAQIRNLVKRIFYYAVVCQIVQTNPAIITPMRFITKARTRT